MSAIQNSLSSLSTSEPEHKVKFDNLEVHKSDISEVESILKDSTNSIISQVASYVLGLLAIVLAGAALVSFISVDFTVGTVIASVALIVAIIAKSLFSSSKSNALDPNQFKLLLKSGNRALMELYGLEQTELNFSPNPSAGKFIPQLKLRDVYPMLLQECEKLSSKVSPEAFIEIKKRLEVEFRGKLDSAISPDDFLDIYSTSIVRINEAFVLKHAKKNPIRAEGEPEGVPSEEKEGEVKESEESKKSREEQVWTKVANRLAQINGVMRETIPMANVRMMIESTPKLATLHLGAFVCLETLEALSKTSIETLRMNETNDAMPIDKFMVNILVGHPNLKVVYFNTNKIIDKDALANFLVHFQSDRHEKNKWNKVIN